MENGDQRQAMGTYLFCFYVIWVFDSSVSVFQINSPPVNYSGLTSS